MCLKRKTSKNKGKNPNRTTTKPIPQHDITSITTTTFLLKTLNKIRLRVLLWCSLHGFIVVYIFFSVQCKLKMNVWSLVLSMFWIWNNTCKIYKTIYLNYLATEDLCFMGNAINKMGWHFKHWRAPEWSHDGELFPDLDLR